MASPASLSPAHQRLRSAIHKRKKAESTWAYRAGSSTRTLTQQAMARPKLSIAVGALLAGFILGKL